MKSPQIERLIPPHEQHRYSDLQVLHSYAGYYIGTLYEDGQPGSRDTEYFRTHDEAVDALDAILAGWQTTTRLEP